MIMYLLECDDIILCFWECIIIFEVLLKDVDIFFMLVKVVVFFVMVVFVLFEWIVFKWFLMSCIICFIWRFVGIEELNFF